MANDPASLAGDFISCIEADPDGRLWLGTNNTGLSVYDPRVNRFVSFHHDAAQTDSLADEDITAIVSDAIGGHWIGTRKGLDYRPVNGRTFTHYRHDPANPASLSDDHVRALLIDRQRVLWIGGDGGLQRLLPGAQTLENIAPELAGADFSGKWQIRSLFLAQDGKIWIGTSGDGLAWLAPGEATPHWALADIARTRERDGRPSGPSRSRAPRKSGWARSAAGSTSCRPPMAGCCAACATINPTPAAWRWTSSAR